LNNLVVLTNTTLTPCRLNFRNLALNPNGNNCALYADGFLEMAIRDFDIEAVPVDGIAIGGSGYKYNLTIDNGQISNSGGNMGKAINVAADVDALSIRNIRTNTPGTGDYGIYLANSCYFPSLDLSGLLIGSTFTTKVQYPATWQQAAVGYGAIGIYNTGLVKIIKGAGTTLNIIGLYSHLLAPKAGDVVTIQFADSAANAIQVATPSPMVAYGVSV
jgi:hypothetical protein